MQIKFPVQDSKEEVSFRSFLWKQKERVAMALLVVIAGAIFFAKGITGKEKLLSDYMQSGLYQAKVRAQKDVDEVKLVQLLKRHPELKPVFSPYLEQTYILEGNLPLAKAQLEESLKRLSFINPLYQEYARISLLIEEGKYEEALTKSTAMGEKLQKESSPNLYGLNLVRVAFLEKILAKSPPSFEKWKEVKSLISNEIFMHFSDENLTLLDFASNA